MPILLVLVVVVFLAAWYLGYVDRWLFEASLERAGETQVSASSTEDALSHADTHGYAYSQLNEEDQKKYRLVETALVTREAQPYPSGDMTDLQRIFQCVQADHPEFFYVDGISMETITNRGSGLVERVTVAGRFAYSPEEVAAISAQLDVAVAQCLMGLPEGSGDYEKSRYFYDWLATNVVYDHDTASVSPLSGEGEEHNVSRTAEGALLKGKAVCGGYAGAFQMLMQKSGLQCVLVTGQGNGGPHAWCLALLDGEYYYVDPTWADPQMTGGSKELGYINYDYLNVTTASIERTHTVETSFPVPECVALKDNYYEREGLLFSSADEIRLGMMAADTAYSGVPLQVRFANESDYLQVRDYFIGNGRIGSYLPGGAYRYNCSDENLSVLILAGRW